MKKIIFFSYKEHTFKKVEGTTLNLPKIKEIFANPIEEMILDRLVSKICNLLEAFLLTKKYEHIIKKKN